MPARRRPATISAKGGFTRHDREAIHDARSPAWVIEPDFDEARGVTDDIAAGGAFPGQAVLTHLLVVSDLSRAVAFYRDVVGAALFREYGGTSAVFQIAGTSVLLP